MSFWRGELLKVIAELKQKQPLNAALTSWAAIVRAAGFDAFAATPSSANLRSLLTDETGTGAAVFANAPTITGVPVFSGIPSLTGGALTFPGTQVPSAGANDLDDYEEGTWTPTLTFGGGSTGITYAFRSGTYVKIGLEVFVEMQINLTSKGSSAGNMLITGLPFTPSVNSGVAVGQYGTFAGNYNLQASIGSTGVTVYQMGTAASSTVLTDANFTNTTFILMSSHYRI